MSREAIASAIAAAIAVWMLLFVIAALVLR